MGGEIGHKVTTRVTKALQARPQRHFLVPPSTCVFEAVARLAGGRAEHATRKKIAYRRKEFDDISKCRPCLPGTYLIVGSCRRRLNPAQRLASSERPRNLPMKSAAERAKSKPGRAQSTQAVPEHHPGPERVLGSLSWVVLLRRKIFVILEG